MIHYDVDRDRVSKLVATIHDVDLELAVMGSDIRSGQVPCHTVAVSQLMADYFLRSSNLIERETIERIRDAIDRERANRGR